MAYEIRTIGFNITTETDTEALSIMLMMFGMDLVSFSSYMGVEEDDIITVDEDEVETVSVWAINYLKDLLNCELVHLGYQTKDIKAQGLFSEYDDVVERVRKALTEGTVTGSQPLSINKDAIITEAGAIKAKFLVNATNVLENFLI